MFSERFWELLEAYVKTAADYGINMLLTPIFTPPQFSLRPLQDAGTKDS